MQKVLFQCYSYHRIHFLVFVGKHNTRTQYLACGETLLMETWAGT